MPGTIMLVLVVLIAVCGMLMIVTAVGRDR
jgi:hypothetical protein